MNEFTPDQDRRAVTRETTRRKAYYSVLSGESPLVSALVLDISPNGLQLESSRPAVAGQRLEIELYPRSGGTAEEVVLVQGQVVWVNELDRVRWTLGVEFLMRRPGQSPLTFMGNRGREEREAFSQKLQAHLEHLDGRLHEAPEASDSIARRASRVMLAPPRGASRRWIWIALLLLLLLFLFGVLTAWLAGAGFGPPSGSGSAGLSTFARFGNLPEPVETDASRQAAGRGASQGGVEETALAPAMPDPAQSIAAAIGLSVPERLAAAQAALAQGGLDGAEALFTAVKDDPEANAMDRFGAEAGLGFVRFARGDSSGAVSGLSALMRDHPEAPAAWLDAVREMRRMFVQYPNVEKLPMPWQNALQLAPLETPPAGDAADAPRRIEVDLDAYTLTVMEGSEPLAVFAAGVGENGSTPAGDFFVANKIKNPDWYNRGDVVKAGDPRNPLGAYWVGLANESGPAPIGIHPTESPESVMNEASRGCIRLFPEDAARVFALCQVGTPVRIFHGAALE